MQNQSSWNDDPFELNGAVQGAASMNHCQRLYFHAEEVISRHAKFDGECYNVAFSSLPEYEQNELARLYLESIERETSECIHGDDFSIDNKFVCALLKMLKNDCRETRESFADVTRRNIILYHHSDIQNFLDEVCDDLLRNQFNEEGFYSQQCKDSGDLIWSKY